MKVSRGFPQGSGLSPRLLNIYTRRLPRHCISSALQFADDTTLASADPSLSVVAHNLTASFNSVKKFSEAHDLVLNPAKTQLIVFKPKGKKLPHDFHLLLNNCTVQPFGSSSKDSETAWTNPRPALHFWSSYRQRRQ